MSSTSGFGNHSSGVEFGRVILLIRPTHSVFTESSKRAISILLEAWRALASVTSRHFPAICADSEGSPAIFFRPNADRLDGFDTIEPWSSDLAATHRCACPCRDSVAIEIHQLMAVRCYASVSPQTTVKPPK